MPVKVSSPRERSTRQTILMAGGLLLLVAALRIPLLDIPFERDEGEYAYIGWRLEHNELPYRDWVDQKPPAIFWVYRLALSLPLEPVRATHFVGLLFAAASSCALFLLGLRFMSQFWAWIAAALFAVLAADPLVQGTAANTELFMLLPLILSQIALLRAASNSQRNVLFMILAGALTGIAITFKQVAAVNWFFLVGLYPVFVAGKERWRGALAFVIWSAAGVIAVLGFAALYFWLRHGLQDLIYNVFTHNLEYISAVRASVRFRLCKDTLALLGRTQMIVWIAAAAGLASLLITNRPKWCLFLAGWIVTSMIGVSASGYFFPHYFQQLLPPLALAAAAGAERLDGIQLLRKFPSWSRRVALGSILALLPAMVSYPFLFTYTPAEAVRKIYPREFFAEMPELGRRIASVTPPEGRVFIFGAEPELLFYARRISATRYIFLFPLYGPYRNALEKQMAAADEILRAQPWAAFYLPNNLFFASGSEQYFTRWSLSYLKKDFYPDTVLTKDASGTAHIVSAPSPPPEQRVLGAILVRKPGNTQ
jgi:4-amino-4-deoxy-L-arabinose transferase-like glycosyltransferase